ncbi:MAG: hypothetical protein AB1646_14020 [Thermodesulfobacteriota bacterium]
MDPQGLSEIEDRIRQLSFADQLELIERLALRIREQLSDWDTFDTQLSEMAADLQIQQEIRRIEEEFAPVSADGLDVAMRRPLR